MAKHHESFERYGLQKRHQVGSRNKFFFIVLLLSCLQLLPLSHSTSSVMADGVQGDGQDLHELSDGDLENICTSRGFQLVREVDDATGELYVYSHEDFIDAARQCLQMEDEM
jgi:hypothetical protein